MFFNIDFKMFDDTIISITTEINYPSNKNYIDYIKEALNKFDFIVIDILDVSFDSKKEICYSYNTIDNYIKCLATIKVRVLMNCPNNVIFIKNEDNYSDVITFPLTSNLLNDEFYDNDYSCMSRGIFKEQMIDYKITIALFNKNLNRIIPIEIKKKLENTCFIGKEIKNPHIKSISIWYNEYIPKYSSVIENMEEEKNIDEKKILSNYSDKSSIITNKDNNLSELLNNYIDKSDINIILPVERPLLSKCVIIDKYNTHGKKITKDMINKFKELIDNLYNLDTMFVSIV